MNCTLTGFFKVMGCLAALLTFSTESAMANSLLLLSPTQLAGNWTFYPQDDVDQACTVQLIAENRTFSPEVECLQTWLGEVPRSWSPTPDGLFLMGEDGTDIVHMNRIEPGHYEVQLGAQRILVMVRANH